MPSQAPRRAPAAATAEETRDPLFVQSVEKAFRVLAAFDASRRTLGLSQLAAATGMDLSATQRFAHTLERLGYLRKDTHTRHFELTTRTLGPAYHFTQSNPLVRRAVPYLVQLSSTTEEATNLSMLEGTNIVFVARFVSRHAVAADVSVGSRSPAFCTAPGIAILSRLPEAEAEAILRASKLRAFTPHTVWHLPELRARLRQAAARGYAVCAEEILFNDISVAAPVLDGDGRPVGAVNVAVSKEHCDAATAERRFAPLVMATAQAISG
jgi:IclR family pca regulon transcriptional regulator